MTSLRYAPGSAHLIAAGEAIVVIDGEASADLLAAIWREVGAGGLAAVLQALTGAYGTTLSAIPPFAVAVAESGGVRIAVRGEITVTATAPTQQTTHLTGAGVTTWSEQVIAGVVRTEISLQSGATADALLPLRDGVVGVSALVVDWTRDAASGQDAPAQDAAPGRGAMAPAVTAPPAEGPMRSAERPAAAPSAEGPTRAAERPPAAPSGESPEPAPAAETAAPAPPAESSESVPRAGGAAAASTADTTPGLLDSRDVPLDSRDVPRASASPLAPPPVVPGAHELPVLTLDATSMSAEGRPAADAPAAADALAADALAAADAPAAADALAAADAAAAPTGGDDLDTVASVRVRGDHDGETISLAEARRARGEGEPASDSTPEPLAPPRPAAPGRLRLSTGQQVPLDRTVVIGRRPRSTRVTGTDLPRLIAVDSPEQDISRSHLEVRVEGDSILATDLHSTNGTTLHRTGADPVRLHPGERNVVVPGDVLDLGDGVTVTVESIA
ncbi:FHA domain-containing protein [Microbacterium protaetiae]|uniref:FHA domain-containing protein n=1 Tax=Microbacterium protaetiae TaxID=2509458 RepID=A0A4P6EIE6_9MICO|nr:FHA domain-containing protein [Microbacterium protaetiae]QAY59937.1 FHA domain-containing protein [Microbacterium protaetiae]